MTAYRKELTDETTVLGQTFFLELDLGHDDFLKFLLVIPSGKLTARQSRSIGR